MLQCYQEVYMNDSYNKEYARRLFYYVDELEGGLLESGIMKVLVGEVLSRVFKDVEKYEIGGKLVDVKKEFTNVKYLGDIFNENFNENLVTNYGLFTKWYPGTAVKTAGNFQIEFFDDRFVVTEIEQPDKKVESLMKPVYQKRYIKTMGKMFGSGYKKHYNMLIKQQKIEQNEDEMKK